MIQVRTKIKSLGDSLIAPRHPNDAIKNMIVPVTIRTIGGAVTLLSIKWLNSFMSARTTAPAIKMPKPDILKKFFKLRNLKKYITSSQFFNDILTAKITLNPKRIYFIKRIPHVRILDYRWSTLLVEN